MKDNFLIKIETFHYADKGTSENIHELEKEQLKRREVVVIDISDPVPRNDYKPDEDPTKYRSEKTGRGPLRNEAGKKWIHSVNPVMTCYKLVTCEFKWLGLQTKVESILMQTEKRLFSNFHRQVFCWADKWHGMTMDDIRALEDKTKDELEKKRAEGKACGTKPLCI